MNEWGLVSLVGARILVLNIFVVLYVIGGRQWKWVRRIVGGLFFSLSCIGLSLLTETFSWWYLLAFIPFNVGLFMGYGGDVLKDKITRRFIFGFTLGLTGFILGLVNESYVLGSLQLILSIVASVLIGTTNEQPAVNEEATIALLSSVIVPFIV